MVWLLPSADTGRALIIILLTYVIAICQFPHIIAGSVEAAFGVVTGSATVADYVSVFGADVPGQCGGRDHPGGATEPCAFGGGVGARTGSTPHRGLDPPPAGLAAWFDKPLARRDESFGERCLRPRSRASTGVPGTGSFLAPISEIPPSVVMDCSKQRIFYLKRNRVSLIRSCSVSNCFHIVFCAFRPSAISRWRF